MSSATNCHGLICRYGVTEDGNSVCAFVHGFEPYVYVEAPTPDFGPDDCDLLRQHVNVRTSCPRPLHGCSDRLFQPAPWQRRQ